jgi:chaperonin GroEL (HSP60 family)
MLLSTSQFHCRNQSPSSFSLEVVGSRIVSNFSDSSDERDERDDEKEEEEKIGEDRRDLIEGSSRKLAPQRSDYHFTGYTCPAIGWRHCHLKCSI